MNQWFREIVQKARKESGLSQWGFAVKFGININTLRNWEQGRNVPDFAVLAGLLRALRFLGQDAKSLMVAIGLDVEAPTLSEAPLSRVELKRRAATRGQGVSVNKKTLDTRGSP